MRARAGRMSTRPPSPRAPVVGTMPTVSPLALARRPLGGRLPEPIDGRRVSFHAKARDAIWQTVRALAPEPGENVLLPSYNCGAEVDAVLKAAAGVRFYRVDRETCVDLQHLRESIDGGTRAVIVTHYFGFPQPELQAIVELCRARGLLLIEDCAHALYSSPGGRPLGTYGDIAVFSLWKTLPIPDGAATRTNGRLRVTGGGVQPSLRRSLDWIRLSVRARLVLRHGRAGRFLKRYAVDVAAAAVKRVPAVIPPPPPAVASGNPHVSFDGASAALTMSAPALLIASRSDHRAIAARRRRNYTLLAAEIRRLGGMRPLHPELPDGVCPLCLPVVSDDAPSLQEHFARRGIGTELFWSEFHPACPAGDFPDATFLKTHVLALPIHQDLDSPALEHVVAAIRAWRAET